MYFWSYVRWPPSWEMVVAILLATVHWEWSWETRIYPTLSAPFFTYSTVRYQCLVANYTTSCSPSCRNVLRAVSHCVSRQQGYSCSSLVCTAVASSLVCSINESIITSTTMLPFQNASWGGRNYHWESALLFVPMTESALLFVPTWQIGAHVQNNTRRCWKSYES